MTRNTIFLPEAASTYDDLPAASDSSPPTDDSLVLPWSPLIVIMDKDNMSELVTIEEVEGETRIRIKRTKPLAQHCVVVDEVNNELGELRTTRSEGGKVEDKNNILDMERLSKFEEEVEAENQKTEIEPLSKFEEVVDYVKKVKKALGKVYDRLNQSQEGPVAQKDKESPLTEDWTLWIFVAFLVLLFVLPRPELEG